MDVFSRTFLPAATEAGVAIQAVSRHMPVLRRCVEADEPTVLVARCLRPDRPLQGEFMLLLTHRRLVVTHETRILRRLRLHLNTDLWHLSSVHWTPDPRLSTVELSATAVDGVRERFLVKAPNPAYVWHVDARLGDVFKPRPAGAVSAAALALRAESRPVRREFSPAIAY